MFSNPYKPSSTESYEIDRQKSEFGSSENSTGVLSRRTIFICILLLLASAVNYMDRQTLAVTASRIKSEFDLDNVQYGRVEAVFGYSFASFGGYWSIAFRCDGFIRSDSWVGRSWDF
jgi:hypothetical protein